MVAQENAKPARLNGYELYVMRHGVAVEHGSAGFSDDSKRPLTLEGKQKMKQITAGLVSLGFDIDWIVTSPLLRARETAEVLAEGLGVQIPVDVCEELAPGGSPEALITFLAKQAKRRRVLVVGHEPDVSALAARLIGAGPHTNVSFRKGGCCLIVFDEFPPRTPGRLVWWITPKLTRKMA